MRRLASLLIAFGIVIMPLAASALTAEEIQQIENFLQSLHASSSTTSSATSTAATSSPATPAPIQVTVSDSSTVPAGVQIGLPSYPGDLSQFTTGSVSRAQGTPVTLPLGAFIVGNSTTTGQEDPRIPALRAQIVQLTQILTDLLASRAASSTASTASHGAFTSQIPELSSTGCPTLKYDMGIGSADETTDYEVSILQNFLARDPDVYPNGLVSGYFGALTQAAVQKWQTAHSIQATGFVGPLTRSALAESCGGSK